MSYSPTINVRDFAESPALLQRSAPKPTQRPSPLNARDELASQLKQLRARRTASSVDDRLFTSRRTEIERRFGQLARRPPNARRQHDTIAHSATGRVAQQLLTALAHPAASWLPPRHFAITQSRALITEGLNQGWAKRCTFWADDEGAALLDGLLVAKADVEHADERPHIVVVVGFAMTYESVVAQAKSFADDFDCVVVLHNSRGVGRSLGTQRSLDQAVEDCKGVLRALHREGKRSLGGYGISMGSATLFRAVEQLQRAGEIGPGDIGLLASVRGLSSIPNVIGAHLGSVLGEAARWLLRRANLPDMDVTHVLEAPLVAAEIMITTAANDSLVRGSGQLAHALGAQHSTIITLPSGQRATCVFNHGRGHVDPCVRTPEHDEVMERWAQRAREAAQNHAAAA